MIASDSPYPLKLNTNELIFLKNFITNPHIEIGDYTYYHDLHNAENFEKENVIIHQSCKLIIGKFAK